MTSERKYIASFFTDKQTTIDYYQEDGKYCFKDGICEGILSSSNGDIYKAKVEIAHIFNVKLEGIKRVR